MINKDMVKNKEKRMRFEKSITVLVPMEPMHLNIK